MLFSSRTVWQIGAAVLCAAFLNACSKNEENLDGEEEPVEPTAETEAAVPPATPAEVEHSASPALPAEVETVPSAPSQPVVSGSATRRVLYVKSSGTAVREKPEANARILSKLDKGDHLLVDIQGDWARTEQGGYIAMKALSEKGIGRSKSAVRWSSGNGDAVKPKKAEKGAAKKAESPTPKPAPAAQDGASDAAAEQPAN